LSYKLDFERGVEMSEITPEERIDRLKNDLRRVVDPELGMNVIELGLIRDVVLDDASAKITMILTTPFCPYAPALINQVRMIAEESMGMPTTIEMGMEMWDPSMMEEGAGAEWGLF
jgi:metal-sulfur cluster biosynthetic enzyme